MVGAKEGREHMFFFWGGGEGVRWHANEINNRHYSSKVE